MTYILIAFDKVNELGMGPGKPSKYTQTLILRTSLPDPFCSLYRIIHYIESNMLSKSSKWELGFVRYNAKFTISRFVISRFECIE